MARIVGGKVKDLSGENEINEEGGSQNELKVGIYISGCFANSQDWRDWIAYDSEVGCCSQISYQNGNGNTLRWILFTDFQNPGKEQT